MARKRSDDSLPPPRLVVPRAEAVKRITAQVEKGREIIRLGIASEEDLQKARAERSKWTKYNTELLTRLFDNASIAREYDLFTGKVIPGRVSFDWWVNDFRSDTDDSITRLESVLERLELIPEVGATRSSPPIRDEMAATGRDVFVVHGHDEAAKESVSRFIEKLGLKAMILHEQPNAGRTVIEKFEDYSSVGFAVVLLTPDDSCATQGSSEPPKSRARQNVILELGYFLGKLGRNKVCALYKEEIELPSDYQGVLYVPMDPAGGWRLALAKEIKQADIEVDLNRAL